MSYKVIILCAQLFLMQSIAAQYIGNGFAENVAWGPSYPMAYGPAPVPYGPTPVQYAPASASYAAASLYSPNSFYVPNSYNPASLAASNACGFSVSSSSPIAPLGVSMMSENAFEGPLAVAGQMPFLGAIGVEGNLPTAGAGTISYGSGNGQIAVFSEGLGYGYPSYSYGAPGYSYEGFY